MSPPQRKYRSREQWQSIIDNFAQSTLSAPAYCEQNNIPYSSFAKWRPKLSEQPGTDTNAALITTAMPKQVLDGSIVDVSLIVGLLINKSLYHLPLHRQHQQMTDNGIAVSRASLTNWTKRGIELLRPIIEAMLLHILLSKVLTMDETPIKAGRQHKGKVRLEQSKPRVDEILAWIDKRCQRLEQTPKHPLTKALNYIKIRSAGTKFSADGNGECSRLGKIFLNARIKFEIKAIF
ncbi:MAG: transposase [Spongiibacteraceae bacterium]